MNLWSTLSRWSISGTLCLFPFVFICGNNDCVSVHFSHSLSVTPSLFLPLHRSRVCSDLWPPPYFWRCWLSMQDKWRCPSVCIQPFEPCVGGSKLSIKCFCWSQEKIWYSRETKVICTRKFNCLSPASLSTSLASPPNQFHMNVQVQMRFKFESVLQPVAFYSLWAPAQIWCQCLSVFM